MSRNIPIYETSPNFTCPNCGEECCIVPDLNHFSYSGTHCTRGKDGVHYPPSWGSPVTDCCGTDVEAQPIEEPGYPDYFLYFLDKKECTFA